MIAIPVPNHNDSLLEMELDGELFFLHFSWNETSGFWSMAIENAYNDEILNGLCLLPHRWLLTPFTQANLPKGDFILVREDDLQAVERSDFVAKKARLIYWEATDEPF